MYIKDRWVYLSVYWYTRDSQITLLDEVRNMFHHDARNRMYQALKARRERMTLQDDGVKEEYEHDNVLYNTTSSECSSTIFCNNHSPSHHILLKRENITGSL